MDRRVISHLSRNTCACLLSRPEVTTVDPLLFLAQARRLETSSEEEDWRTGASRAYYAAFYVACAFMANLGFAVPNAERAHGYLWMRLQNSSDASVERAGRLLNDLRR